MPNESTVIILFPFLFPCYLHYSLARDYIDALLDRREPLRTRLLYAPLYLLTLLVFIIPNIALTAFLLLLTPFWWTLMILSLLYDKEDDNI
jgi:hypothetical protein